MVRQGSAKPSLPGSNPGAASFLAVVAIFLVAVPGASPSAARLAEATGDADAPVPQAGATGQQSQEPKDYEFTEWEEAWISDVPAVDLSGRWVFDPARSDPMLAQWRDARVVYEIRQHPGNIVLEFLVEGGYSNQQAYRWDGTVHRFERGGRQVREEARWTDSGETLQIRGRHFDVTRADEDVRYRFSYRLERGVLTFVQEDGSGTTTWRFVREQ